MPELLSDLSLARVQLLQRFGVMDSPSALLALGSLYCNSVLALSWRVAVRPGPGIALGLAILFAQGRTRKPNGTPSASAIAAASQPLAGVRPQSGTCWTAASI